MRIASAGTGFEGRKGHSFAGTLLCHTSFAGVSDYSHADTSSLSVKAGMGRIHFQSNKFSLVTAGIASTGKRAVSLC